jgi:hypothetical protein
VSPGIHVVHTKFISFISVLSLLLLVASLKAGEESSLEHIKAATQSMDLMTFEEAREKRDLFVVPD